MDALAQDLLSAIDEPSEAFDVTHDGTSELPTHLSKKPRDYQQEIIDDALLKLRAEGRSRRVLVYLPTGGGKTLIGAAVMHSTLRREAGARCLFVVNNKLLLEQTRNSLLELDFPDASIGIIAGCGGRSSAPDALVQIAMIQTLIPTPKAGDATAGPAATPAALDLDVSTALDSRRDYSLVVVDEAHASNASRYTQLLGALRRDTPVLGLTATPFRSKPDESLANVFPPSGFVRGPLIGSLIEQRCLVPPVVCVPSVRPSGKRGDAALLLRAGLEMWQMAADNARTVAFCRSVDESRQLSHLFSMAGVAAAHMDGTTKPDERTRRLEQLRSGELRVLCNVDVASEGFDEPSVGCVLLLRPFGDEGLRLYIQQVGRALRPAPWASKERCIVLDLVGATHRFGPITGPPASDYSFERSNDGGADAKAAAEAKRARERAAAAMVRRIDVAAQARTEAGAATKVEVSTGAAAARQQTEPTEKAAATEPTKAVEEAVERGIDGKPPEPSAEPPKPRYRIKKKLPAAAKPPPEPEPSIDALDEQLASLSVGSGGGSGGGGAAAAAAAAASPSDEKAAALHKLLLGEQLLLGGRAAAVSEPPPPHPHPPPPLQTSSSWSVCTHAKRRPLTPRAPPPPPGQVAAPSSEQKMRARVQIVQKLNEL